jgi:hypothetical protein
MTGWNIAGHPAWVEMLDRSGSDFDAGSGGEDTPGGPGSVD